MKARRERERDSGRKRVGVRHGTVGVRSFGALVLGAQSAYRRRLVDRFSRSSRVETMLRGSALYSVAPPRTHMQTVCPCTLTHAYTMHTLSFPKMCVCVRRHPRTDHHFGLRAFAGAQREQKGERRRESERGQKGWELSYFGPRWISADSVGYDLVLVGATCGLSIAIRGRDDDYDAQCVEAVSP